MATPGKMGDSWAGWVGIRNSLKTLSFGWVVEVTFTGS